MRKSSRSWQKISNFVRNIVFCAAGWIEENHRLATSLGTVILNLSKVGAVNSMEDKSYLSPAVEVLELYSEGVLCSSSGTEMLEENEGIW